MLYLSNLKIMSFINNINSTFFIDLSIIPLKSFVHGRFERFFEGLRDFL